ncbi:olfactory receptor 1f45-like [Pelodytes ibericus]
MENEEESRVKDDPKTLDTDSRYNCSIFSGDGKVRHRYQSVHCAKTERQSRYIRKCKQSQSGNQERCESGRRTTSWGYLHQYRHVVGLATLNEGDHIRNGWLSIEIMNGSFVTEFILMGLSRSHQQQAPLFALFVSTYLITLLGNVLIMAVISQDHKLHIPMYFFLGNLSFVDICFSSVTAPLMLVNLLLDKRAISFKACMTQLFFLFCTASMESFILAIMAYDRLVAISNPLRYSSIMNRKTCLSLISSSWMCASFHSLLHTLIVSSLTFCGPNQIHEHFCDLPPLLALSCSDTSGYDLLVFTEGSLVAMSPFVFVVVSYAQILKTISMIRLSAGQYRTFSTCSSHLISVGVFFGSIFFTYFRPSSSSSMEDDRTVTVVYSVLTPLLNPFIYSIKNQQVMGGLRKILGRQPLLRIKSN